MKKGLLIGVCFLFILIVLISFASAGFFSDFFGKITGHLIKPQDIRPISPCYCPTGYECGRYTPIDTTCGIVNCGVCASGETCDVSTHTCTSKAEQHSTHFEGVKFGEYNSFDDGGDSSYNAAECCGDDDNEFFIHKVVDVSQTTNTIKTDTSDFACCDKPTDCVADNVCYSSNMGHQNPGPVSKDKNSGEYCLNGVWYDEPFNMRSATLGFPDLWTVKSGKLSRIGYGEFSAEGYTTLESKAIFPIWEGFNYVLSGEFASPTSEKLYFGFVPLDENQIRIKVAEINAVFTSGNVEVSKLKVAATATSNSITLDNCAIISRRIGTTLRWNIDQNSYIAFDAKSDFSDLPNRDVYKIVSLDKDTCELILSPSLKKDYAKDTLVRHHKDSSSYMYSAAPGNPITSAFVTYSSGELKVEGVSGVDLYHEFWPGTRYVQVLILANYDASDTATTTFKDLSLTRNSDSNGLKYNFPNPSVGRIYGIAEFVTSIKRTGYNPAPLSSSVINWDKMVVEDDSADCTTQSCVFNGVCYPRANLPHVNSPSMSALKGVGFNPSGADNIAFCYTNEWLDCDVGDSWCEDACGLHWADSGESNNFGEYGSFDNGGDSVSGKECCGDDDSEFFIYQVVDSSATSANTNKGIFACCDKPTDCVSGGECFDSGVAHDNVFTVVTGTGGVPTRGRTTGVGILPIHARVIGGSITAYCLNGVWYDEAADVPAKYVSKSSEYKRGVQTAGWGVAWDSDSTDKKNCDDLSCVFNNVCYPPTDNGLLSISNEVGFNPSGADNIAFCYTDDWEDCDGSKDRCENSCGLDWAYPGEFTEIADPYCGDGECNGVETCGDTDTAIRCNSDCGECVVIPIPVTCNDGDANDDYPYGKNYEEFGSYPFGSDPPKFKDICGKGKILGLGHSKNELKEYYCDDLGKAIFEWHDCTNDSMVCDEGACIVEEIICGNGTIDAGEECDDGNTDSGDGCSNGCVVESGYNCTGVPSVCVQVEQCIPEAISKTCKNRECGIVVNDKTCGEDVVCGDACLTGVCLPKEGCVTCYDPDEGANSYMVKETTRGRGVNDKTDECTDDGLREYVCNGSGVLDYFDYDCVCSGGECNSGWVCDSSGQCIDTGDCFDAGGGKMRMKYGLNDIDSALSNDSKEKIKKIIKKINVECGASINEINILDKSLYNPPKNTRIIEVLEIKTDITTDANLSFNLNKSEIASANDIGFYVLEDDQWAGLNVTLDTIVNTTPYYDYEVEVPHFSIFLITEPYFCGNGDFDSGEEVCDGSVDGVTHCISDCSACESGFEVNESGFCLEIPEEDIGCSEEGDTKCRGYNFYECDNNLEWDRQGIVVGNCSVECSPIANTSCQGDYSLLCGADYKWAIQGNIDGLCGYVSPTGGTPLGDTYNNEDETPEAGEDDEETNWFLVILIVGVAILILVIVFVLFKIFSREKGKIGLTTSNNYPTRPRPKRPPVQRPYR